MEIFATDQIAANFELSPLNRKEFLGWAVQYRTIPSQKIVPVQKAKKRERKKESSISIFAIRDPPVLQEVGTE